MRNLILHVGHPKTGTTALQSVLAANSEQLLINHAVLYPIKTNPAKIKHSLAIPWLLGIEFEALRRAGRASGDELKNLSKEFWESIVEEANSSSYQWLVLSGEGFWNIKRLRSEQVNFFRSNLLKLADRITISGYLKSPAPYFLSMINQKLRNFRSVPMPSPKQYQGPIEAWEKIGADNYEWRLFDRQALENNDIVDDFCTRFLPETISTENLQRGTLEKSNESVSNEALALLEKIARMYPHLTEETIDYRRHKIIDILKSADQQIGGSKRPSLNDYAKSALINRCEDLEWLKERGIDFPDINADAITDKSAILPPTFTSVEAFCPIDKSRLRELESAAMGQIKALFKPKVRQLIWLFSGRKAAKNQNNSLDC
jgi:hypothetical protein